MTSDMILGAILGALIISAALSVAQAIGLIHIGLGREQREAAPRPAAPPAPVAAAPRLGCTITVEAKSDSNAAGLTPQVRLFATIDNQGAAPVRSLRGYWRVVTPDKFKHPQIRIERGILAPHNQYLESYLLDEGVDMQGEGVRFDVEVEFDYMAHSDTDNRHYSAKFRYDRKYHRMIRL